MPGINRFEFLKAVGEEHPRIPFMFCTGKGNEEVARKAISVGVTDYLERALALTNTLCLQTGLKTSSATAGLKRN